MKVAVHLVEPVLYSRRHRAEPTPIPVKGLLELELNKPTRITALNVSLVGKWRTDWPSGLPPSYIDHAEEHSVVSTQDILFSDKFTMSLRSSAGSESPTPPRTPESHSRARSPDSTVTRKSLLASATSKLKELAKSSVLPDGPEEQIGTEFPAGSYTCPFVFSLPHDAAPTIHLPLGECTYFVKVVVHRPGVFASNVTSTTPLTVVMLPDEDRSRGSGVEERRWEDKLLYAFHADDRHYVIGESIPFELTLVPLEKLSIHHIAVVLQERVTYRSRDLSSTNHERDRFTLLSVKQSRKATPILPVLPTSPSGTLALVRSPPGVLKTDGRDSPNFEYVQQLQSLSGPWNLRYSIMLPDPSSSLHFTFDRRPESVIEIEHELQITIMVSTADDPHTLHDIHIAFPVQILSSHCGPAWVKLPSYYEVPRPNTIDPYHYLLKESVETQQESSTSLTSLETNDTPEISTLLRTPDEYWGGWSSFGHRIIQSHSEPVSSTPSRSSTFIESSSSETAQHARRFASLIGGREGVSGEIPPTYQNEPLGSVQIPMPNTYR